MAERDAESWVRVGRVGKTFGLKGEVVIHPTGEDPQRFRPGAVLRVVTPEGAVTATVATLREMPGKLVASFEGRDDIEAIRPWVGCELEVRTADLPALEEGSYYHFQLLGLEVYGPDGRRLGVLEEILTGGGNDVYCVRGDGPEILVPAVREAIESIDVKRRRLVLKDMKGLITP